MIKREDVFLLLIISLILFSACVKQPDKMISDTRNTEKTLEYPNIYVDAEKIECDYIEPIYGDVKTFCLSSKNKILEDVLNDWVKELLKRGISYGTTANGEDILDGLLVVDAYFEGDNVIIVMNDIFKAFESSASNNYTNPGNFLFGLKDILSKVTDSESMTIYYNSKESDVINPEGYLIDNIPLKD